MPDPAPAAAATAPVCCVCGAQSAQRCSRCHPDRSSFFCSTDCQRLIWSYHKQVCGKDEPYFPFPVPDSKDREYIKRTSVLPTNVAEGLSLEYLTRHMLPPSPNQGADSLIDDFLDGKKQVVQRSRDYAALAIIDNKPVFPLLGWMYAHLYDFKHFRFEPAYRNPAALTADVMFSILTVPMSTDLPKAQLTPIEAFPEGTKVFLDAMFVFAVLLERWHSKDKPRPPQLTLGLLHASLDRALAKTSTLPFSEVELSYWLERGQAFKQLRFEIDGTV